MRVQAETPATAEVSQDLIEYALRLGDSALLLGQRLGEWCGHAPELEDDIALSNIALDLIGQARLLLGLAGEWEGAAATRTRWLFCAMCPNTAT